MESYLLDDQRLSCTALELYAARCGLVHTLTPDSQLAAKGIRRISYSWGNAKSRNLQRLINDSHLSDKTVAVQVEDLFKSWRSGILKFINEVHEDAEKASGVYERANNFFSSLGYKQFDPLFNNDSE